MGSRAQGSRCLGHDSSDPAQHLATWVYQGTLPGNCTFHCQSSCMLPCQIRLMRFLQGMPHPLAKHQLQCMCNSASYYIPICMTPIRITPTLHDHCVHLYDIPTVMECSLWYFPIAFGPPMCPAKIFRSLQLVLHCPVPLQISDVNLLVCDECHRAVKRDPYNCIMQEFYHNISAVSPHQCTLACGYTSLLCLSKWVCCH